MIIQINSNPFSEILLKVKGSALHDSLLYAVIRRNLIICLLQVGTEIIEID
jgi:hypothetical protein